MDRISDSVDCFEFKKYMSEWECNGWVRQLYIEFKKTTI
jgi:hypothetical protein